MTDKNISKITIALSSILYIASLTQTAYCTGKCNSSLMVVAVGILGIITELGAVLSFIIEKVNGHNVSIDHNIGATFVWLANPIILFSLFIFQHGVKTAFMLSIFSTLLILSFMAFDKVINNEAGGYSTITELKLGYWLWLCSSLTLFIGSIFTITKRS